jgi:hypothetical protein
VDCHAGVKGGHFLGEAFASFAPKSLGPLKERPLRCVCESAPKRDLCQNCCNELKLLEKYQGEGVPIGADRDPALQ